MVTDLDNYVELAQAFISWMRTILEKTLAWPYWDQRLVSHYFSLIWQEILKDKAQSYAQENKRLQQKLQQLDQSNTQLGSISVNQTQLGKASSFFTHDERISDLKNLHFIPSQNGRFQGYTGISLSICPSVRPYVYKILVSVNVL